MELTLYLTTKGYILLGCVILITALIYAIFKNPIRYLVGEFILFILIVINSILFRWLNKDVVFIGLDVVLVTTYLVWNLYWFVRMLIGKIRERIC